MLMENNILASRLYHELTSLRWLTTSCVYWQIVQLPP